MPSINTSLARTTTLATSDQLLGGLRRTQVSLADLERQISTGKAVEKPSDAPNKVAAILALEARLEARQQEESNGSHGVRVLNNVDAALSDVTDILLESRSIAASQVGITSDADTRRLEANVIDGQLQAVIDIANRHFQDIALFGGGVSFGSDQPVFESFLGGVRYRGGASNIQGDFGLSLPVDFNSNGVEAFGSLSSRVTSPVDLDPQLTAATRLSDLNGALGLGIRKGAIEVDVNGTTALIDLTTADSANDIVTRVNDAINTIDPAAGALAINGSAFELTANVGHTITLADTGTGQTAADLGVQITSAGGVPALGLDLDPKLTDRTSLAALGATVDFLSGLQLTQGAVTKVADFSTASTVQDLKNVILELEMGVRLEINASQTGLNLISEVSGVGLSIGENGGTTAEDLGLRSFGLNTLLSDFRNELGVESQQGVDDFAFELHDGSTFNVNLDGAKTVNDVLTAINTAATGAGLTVGAPGAGGTDFNVGLSPSGNGFHFEDNTAGGGDFRVVQLGISLAATHLGIYKNAQAGGTLAGDDVAQVRTESVFTHLINLRDTLRNNDELGITLAGSGLEKDIDNVSLSRADVGVKTQRLENQVERLQELQISERATLSQLQDADLTEVITRLLQLQNQLSASMQSGLTGLQLSLFDFLR